MEGTRNLCLLPRRKSGPEGGTITGVNVQAAESIKSGAQLGSAPASLGRMLVDFASSSTRSEALSSAAW